MDAKAKNVDAVIAGSGPVGLFLAHEIARRGHTVRVFEKNPGQSQHSKAIALMPRTLEAFGIAGIADRFVAVQNRVTEGAVIEHHREIGKIPLEPTDTDFPYVSVVPQDVSERLLHDALVERGGSVDYTTELETIEQTADGVRVTVRAHDGTQSTVSAKYVAGCDGAHSAVRHLIGGTFEGAEYPQAFALFDVETSGDLPANQLQICPHPDGPLAIFPLSATRRRIIAISYEAMAGEPSLADLEPIIRERGPADFRATSLIWSSTFRIHHRQAANMRDGRAFLAGDAAHIHSPFGAQGMNTGLQDAWNLAWKLDFALRGLSTDTLLESYSAERHPIAEAVIAFTDRATRALSSSNPVFQAVRSAAIPVLAHLEPLQKLLVSNLTELGISLKDSPIVAGDGRRAPRETYGMLDGRYLLLHPQRPDLTARCQALVAEFDGAISCRVRDGDDDRILLIRPDAYVAAESRPRPSETFVDDVRALLATHLVRA